jgi:hypothetical protein
LRDIEGRVGRKRFLAGDGPSTQDAEAGGSLNSIPSSEILSQNKTKHNKKRERFKKKLTNTSILFIHQTFAKWLM